jgi:hypothetical protein
MRRRLRNQRPDKRPGGGGAPLAEAPVWDGAKLIGPVDMRAAFKARGFRWAERPGHTFAGYKSASSIPDSKKTDLGGSDFLWLNRDRDFCSSEVQSARERQSTQGQLLPARGWLTKRHLKGVWCGHLFSIGS